MNKFIDRINNRNLKFQLWGKDSIPRILVDITCVSSPFIIFNIDSINLILLRDFYE